MASIIPIGQPVMAWSDCSTRAVGQSAPPGRVRGPHRSEAQHGRFQFLVRGVEVDLVDARAAPVVRTQHRRVAIGLTYQRLDALRDQRTELGQRGFGDGPQCFAEGAARQPLQVFVGPVPVAVVERWDVRSRRVTGQHRRSA
ncbi:MAG: hypothetical protein E6J45_03085 [Chloroflexi bacterium]|nr:MAG: hypothetical protein E6J45_03085 [Chloroflexota bacterium]